MSNCCDSSTTSPKSSTFDWLLWGSILCVTLLFALHFYFDDTATSWVVIMSQTTYEIVHSVWWGVLIGFLMVGILSQIPREFIMSILGKGGSFSGLLRATGAGVLFDLCSHGILMVGVKLYERGASAGQVIAFLLASPWNSFSLTLILIGLIGLGWTLTFILLSMVVALATGWIFDYLTAHKVLPQNKHTYDIPEDFQFWAEAKTRLAHTHFNFIFFSTIIRNGIQGSRIVLRWLLFGIVLASAIRAILDQSTFEQYFGPTFVGLMATLAFATILEVCSEGSAPIAADLLTRAKAPGNSFSFLMAGVATDYTEIVVLQQMSKSWTFALFLPLITVPQIALMGYLINLSI